MTTAIWMLAYGMPADAMEEYMRIGESTTVESLKRFCRAIISIHEEEYLGSLTTTDISKLLREEEKRGFPGMLGSLDCMHWSWKNCLAAWHGQYISHLTEGRAPPANYTINGHQYTMGYFLADGNYPHRETLVQTISQPQGLKRQLFATMQEAYRKDVERAFGVLQASFAIVHWPARFLSHEDLGYIMKTCIILHNMIIEDKHDDSVDDDYDPPEMATPIQVSREPTPLFTEFIPRDHMI
ncbi:hypothetical protein HHK36_031601 [Tetracentron sinense]|uniref:Nuclease HARBI1 n=1 Tax=Tetracentron sinense TaxID=13715 RepID=A0A834Y6V2_TETSI|nr:hypothetical protein HHK36_031601 [Tetracentron sinense]